MNQSDAIGRIPRSELIEVPQGIFARHRAPSFPVFEDRGTLVKEAGGRETNTVFVVRDDADRLHTDARDMASIIPFGQPILVGHHSEKRDRNYRGRIHKKFERSFEAQ